MLLSLLAPVASSYVTLSINSTLAELGIYNTSVIALPVAAFGISGATVDTYFIDSCCNRTICCNSSYMQNLRCIKPVLVNGLTGYKSYDITGDLYFPLVSDAFQIQTLVVENALFDSTGDINLIASDDINATSWDVNLSANPSSCGLYKYDDNQRLPIARVLIEKCGKLHTLQIDNYAVPALIEDPTCCSARCGNLSLEELFHQRMAH
eukprot:1404379-Rhodomonas_salina.1